MKIVTAMVKAKNAIKHKPFDGIDGYFDYQTYQLKSNKNVNFDVTGAGLYGILYKDINASMYDFIVRNNPKIKFWVDFGKTDIHKLQKYQNLDKVFCSETSKEFDLSSNKNNCKICSLDYQSNILGNVTLSKQKRYLPKKIILMDLSQVGSTKNMSFSLVRKYLKLKNKHDIYIAGGLKSTLDLNRAKFLGIKGVLATSIFIKQRIPKLYITKEKTNLKK